MIPPGTITTMLEAGIEPADLVDWIVSQATLGGLRATRDMILASPDAQTAVGARLIAVMDARIADAQAVSDRLMQEIAGRTKPAARPRRSIWNRRGART